VNVLFLIGVARRVEALRYKQEGCWFDFRWVSLGFFIVAQWALARLGIEQRRLPGLSPGGVKAAGD
jgi:hypothetical protein